MPATTPQTTRRVPGRRALALLVAALVGVALVAGACSSDESAGDGSGDDKGSTTSTTAAGDDGGDGGDGSDTSGPSTTEVDFNATVTQLSEQLQDADGDMCKIIQLSAGISSDPSTSDEVERAVTFTTDWLVAMAEAAPDELSAEAENVRNAAEQLSEAARSADYPADFFTSDAAGAIGTPELQTSMQALAATCASSATGGATGGAGNG